MSDEPNVKNHPISCDPQELTDQELTQASGGLLLPVTQKTDDIEPNTKQTRQTSIVVDL